MDLVSQITAFLSVPLLWLRMMAPAAPPCQTSVFRFQFKKLMGGGKKALTELIQKFLLWKSGPFREGIFWLSEFWAALLPVWFISGQPRGVEDSPRPHTIWKENLSRSEALSKETLRRWQELLPMPT